MSKECFGTMRLYKVATNGSFDITFLLGSSQKMNFSGSIERFMLQPAGLDEALILRQRYNEDTLKSDL